MKDLQLKYYLRISDNALILGQRLAELCSNGPFLEEDIAMSNLGLDLFGQARILYTLAGKFEGKGRTEDDFAYRRPEHEFVNVLLVEQPNGHFGHTMVRHFLYSSFVYHQYLALEKSRDEDLAAFATKSLKEIKYHLRHSAEWMHRLGLGTDESHAKLKEAFTDLLGYRYELFETDEVEETLIKEGIAANPNLFQEKYEKDLKEMLEVIGMSDVEEGWKATGGRRGHHSEHLGHILSEFQYLVRAYPDATW